MTIRPVGVFPNDPLDYTGIKVPVVPVVGANRDPNDNDNKYTLMTEWLNESTQTWFKLVGFTNGLPVWVTVESAVGGILPVNEGGTGVATITAHGVMIGEGTNPIHATSAGTSGQVLQSKGAALDPDWTTATYPATTTINQVLYSSAANTVSGLSTANDGLLVTGNTGIPSILAGPGTTGQFLQSNAAAAPSFSSASMPSSATQGDMLYASATNVWSQLAKSTTPGSTLQNIGASNAPAWAPSSGGSGIGFKNVGFTYGSSTFSVKAQDGTALSATNPALVTFQSSTTPGVLKTIAVTANQGFIDSTGASQIIGNLFGTTAAVAWAQDMPFFVYAVLNSAAGSPETACTFMISRTPYSVLSPAAGNIATLGGANADSQADFFALSAITAADYASSPCVWIGSFRMRKNGSDDWAVQALSKQDGPGVYSETNLGAGWLFPLGQNGADASNWFSGTATVPIITVAGSAYIYTLYRNGRVNIQLNGLSLATNGTGAGQLKLNLPVWDVEGNIGTPPGFFRYQQNSKLATYYAMRNNDTNNNYVTFGTLVAGSVGAAGDVLQCASVTSAVNAITNICCNITYQGF